MSTTKSALGGAVLTAIWMSIAGCAAPPQRAQVNDTAVMGAGEESPTEAAAIAESLGFHGPRRNETPER